jgi:predicted transposase YbfD/YdcC
MPRKTSPIVIDSQIVAFPTDTASLCQRLQDCFKAIEDPRASRTLLHQLSDILTIAILSVLAGGQGWEDMVLYGESKQGWLSTFLPLPNGIPCADTFRRVFERIHPDVLEQCLAEWVRSLSIPLTDQVVALDGKSLKGSYDRSTGVKALHLVSAWASQSRLVLAQTKVSDKSNEITAIPVLLELLEIDGSIVTMDAMGTQKQIAAQIQEAGADYVLALKANHPTLFQKVSQVATTMQANLDPSEHTVEAGHHRTEHRKVWSFPVALFAAIPQIKDWIGLQTIVQVERTRHLWNKTTHETHLYLSSLVHDSPRIAQAIRQHWGIDNRGDGRRRHEIY